MRDYIDKEFVHKGHLATHIKNVHGTKEMKCSEENCTYKAADLVYMKQHIKRVHNEDKKRYPCPNCDFKSSSKSGLEKHLQYIHLNTPKASCNICGAVLRSDQLERHKQMVHYNTEVKCNRCGKMLKGKEGLQSHLRIHERNDKGIEHKCEMCNFSFRFVISLKKWILMSCVT